MKQMLWLKLGSIAVHAEELLSPDGHEFDKQAIRGLLADPEVRRFLDAPANSVYLPRKRSADGSGTKTPETTSRAEAATRPSRRIRGAAR